MSYSFLNLFAVCVVADEAVKTFLGEIFSVSYNYTDRHFCSKLKNTLNAFKNKAFFLAKSLE